MKYTAAVSMVDAYGSNQDAPDHAFKFVALSLLCEIFGCLDQISIHTRELAATQAELLESFKERSNGK